MDDERAAGPEKLGSRPDELIDCLLADEREVRDGDIDRDVKLAARDRLVRCDTELATAGRSRLFDECGNDIDADDSLDALCAERAHEPSLTASEIENGLRPLAHHRIDDGPIGHELAALDAPFADG